MDLVIVTVCRNGFLMSYCGLYPSFHNTWTRGSMPVGVDLKKEHATGTKIN